MSSSRPNASRKIHRTGIIVGGTLIALAVAVMRIPPDTAFGTAHAWRWQRTEASLIDLLRDNGISFPPESDVLYSEPNATFTITNTPSNLDLAEALFTQLAIEESRERAGF